MAVNNGFTIRFQDQSLAERIDDLCTPEKLDLSRRQYIERAVKRAVMDDERYEAMYAQAQRDGIKAAKDVL